MNIINLRNYGNLSDIKQDSIALNNILDNQGMNFVIDNIATYIGEQRLRWNLSSEEVNKLRDSLIDDLKNAISERT